MSNWISVDDKNSINFYAKHGISNPLTILAGDDI